MSSRFLKIQQATCGCLVFSLSSCFVSQAHDFHWSLSLSFFFFGNSLFNYYFSYEIFVIYFKVKMHKNKKE